MRRYLLLIIFLIASKLLFSQSNYKYVIIPTQFPEITSGFNPFGICGEIQKILNERSIKSVFETAERSSDYCEALNVKIIKTSSMFKTKLKVELCDCFNKVVWSKEGTGNSKEFQKGYAEALADALKELNELPVNTTQQYMQNVSAPVTMLTPETMASPKAPSTPIAAPAWVKKPINVLKTTANKEIYKPENLYFNSTYFVDVLDGKDGEKRLIIINGELLGYKNLQNIAVLSPSGLNDIYFLTWFTSEGESISGVANFENTKLNLSLSTDIKPVIINLMKQ